MARASIDVWLDEDVRRQFDALCEELGMSMNTALNVFAKAFVREGGFPFAVSLNRAAMDTLEAVEEVDSGRNLFGPYRSIQELKEALDA